MKKYIYYHWTEDNEGGDGICKSEKWTIGLNTILRPDGRTCTKIDEFDTAEEFAAILIDIGEREDTALYVAEEWIYSLLSSDDNYKLKPRYWDIPRIKLMGDKPNN